MQWILIIWVTISPGLEWKAYTHYTPSLQDCLDKMYEYELRYERPEYEKYRIRMVCKPNKEEATRGIWRQERTAG